MSRGRVVFLLLAAVVAVAAGLALRDVIAPPPPQSPAPVAGPPRPAPRAPAPASAQPSRPPLLVTASDGKKVDLAAASGKLRVVHFWATWCAPCADELPGLLAWSREAARDPKIEVLAIAVDTDIKAVTSFLAKTGATALPTYLDPDGPTARQFGTVKFPETWFLGPDGTVLGHWIGPQDWSDPARRAEIARFRTKVRA